VFFPIGDDNPSVRRPYVTWTLVGLNVLVFVLVNLMGRQVFGKGLNTLLREGGFIPQDPEILDCFTSMFLHAGIIHLAGNMLFLWIFGDNVEDKLGPFLFAVFYLLSGAFAVGLYLVFPGRKDIPLVGASGAISGVLGCYMVFFPAAKVRVFYWFFFIFLGTFMLQAKWFLGIYIGMNLFEWLVLENQYVTGVAYAAHVGGFAVGVMAAVITKGRLRRTGRLTRIDELTGFAGGPTPGRKVPHYEPTRHHSPQKERMAPEHGPMKLSTTDRVRKGFVSPRIETRRDGEGFFGIEEAIAGNVKSGQLDVAVEKYTDYVRMRHAKALPAWAQIEIAGELFRRNDYEGALEAYRRYLAHFPSGPDAPEARFRLGIILSRHRKEYFRAREYLLQAAVEHPDEQIVGFARKELKRIEPFL